MVTVVYESQAKQWLQRQQLLPLYPCEQTQEDSGDPESVHKSTAAAMCSQRAKSKAWILLMQHQQRQRLSTA